MISKFLKSKEFKTLFLGGLALVYPTLIGRFIFLDLFKYISSEISNKLY